MFRENITKYIEKKSQQPIFRWFLNLFLIFVILVNAQIGCQLGIPGESYAVSAVWPPTGFSLAALLLFGYWVWPGIFLGNFCNSIFLLFASNSIESSIIVASCTAIGSTLQALVAAYIILKYAAEPFCNSVKDLIIFLLPGGILPCLIASSIGVTTLYMYGLIAAPDFFHTWMTFWIGDTLGVYIFAPLIVVWSICKPYVLLRSYRLEACLISVGFIVVTLLTYFIRDYPLAHLFLPLSFWAACRFRMHGATLSTFFLTIMIVVPTALERGPYIAAFGDPLLLIVSYIEVIAALTLILSALLNERDTTLTLIKQMKNQEQDLQDAFLELGGKGEKQILVPIDAASLSLSLAQNLDVQFDTSNMTITPKERVGKIRVHVAFRK